MHAHFFLAIVTHGPCMLGTFTQRHAPPFLTLVAVFSLFLTLSLSLSLTPNYSDRVRVGTVYPGTWDVASCSLNFRIDLKITPLVKIPVLKRNFWICPGRSN